MNQRNPGLPGKAGISCFAAGKSSFCANSGFARKTDRSSLLIAGKLSITIGLAQARPNHSMKGGTKSVLQANVYSSEQYTVACRRRCDGSAVADLEKSKGGSQPQGDGY